MVQRNDYLNISDGNPIGGLKGEIVVRDALTGKVVQRNKNIITLQGRAHVLKLLFGIDEHGSEITYDNDNIKKVCAFKIGGGGADLDVSAFESIAPKYSDTDVYNPIPFVIVDPNKAYDTTKVGNPSYVESLSNNYSYIFNEDNIDGSTNYYGKIITTNDISLQVNENTGECYIRLTLQISKEEARGFIYNELGLFLVSLYDNGNGYSVNGYSMFSHVTLDSDALKSLTRGVLIEYFIYA